MAAANTQRTYYAQYGRRLAVGPKLPRSRFWTVRFQLACPGIFENSIDRLVRAFAVEVFCGLEKV